MFEYTDQDGNVLSESEVQKLAKEAKTKLSYYTTEKKLKRREVKAKEETSPFPKTEGLDPLGVEKMQSLSTTETTKPKLAKKQPAKTDIKNPWGTVEEDKLDYIGVKKIESLPQMPPNNLAVGKDFFKTTPQKPGKHSFWEGILEQDSQTGTDPLIDEDKAHIKLQEHLNKNKNGGTDFTLSVPSIPGINQIDITSKLTGNKFSFAWSDSMGTDKKSIASLNEFLYINSENNPDKTEINAYKQSGITGIDALWAYNNPKTTGYIRDFDNHVNGPGKTQARGNENFTDQEKIDYIRGLSINVTPEISSIVADDINLHPSSEIALKNVLKSEEAKATYVDNVLKRYPGLVMRSGLPEATIAKKILATAESISRANEIKSDQKEIDAITGNVSDNIKILAEQVLSKETDPRKHEAIKANAYVNDLEIALSKYEDGIKGKEQSPTSIEEIKKRRATIEQAKVVANKLSSGLNPDDRLLYSTTSNRTATVPVGRVNTGNPATVDITPMVNYWSKVYGGLPNGKLGTEFLSTGTLFNNNLAEGQAKQTVLIRTTQGTYQGYGKVAETSIEKTLKGKGYKITKLPNGDIIAHGVPTNVLSSFTNQDAFMQFNTNKIGESLGVSEKGTGETDIYSYSLSSKKIGKKIDAKLNEWQTNNIELKSKYTAISDAFLLKKSVLADVTMNPFSNVMQGLFEAVNPGYETGRDKSQALQNVLEAAGVELKESTKVALIPTGLEEVSFNTGGMLPVVAKIGLITAATGAVGNFALGAEFVAGFRALRTSASIADRAFFHVGSALIEEGNLQLAGFEPGAGLAFYAVGAAAPIKLRPFNEYNWAAVNNVSNVIYKGGLGGIKMEVSGVVEHAIEIVGTNKKMQDFINDTYPNISAFSKRFLQNSISFTALDIPSAYTKYFFKSGKEVSKALYETQQQLIIATQELTTNPEINKKEQKQKIENLKLGVAALTKIDYNYRYQKGLETTEGLKNHVESFNKQLLNDYETATGSPLKVEVVTDKPGAKEADRNNSGFAEPAYVDGKWVGDGVMTINYNQVMLRSPGEGGIINNGIVAHEQAHLRDFLAKKASMDKFAKEPNAEGKLPTSEEVFQHGQQYEANKHKKMVDLLVETYTEMTGGTQDIYKDNLVNHVTDAYAKYEDPKNPKKVSNPATVRDEILKKIIEDITKASFKTDGRAKRNIFKELQKRFLELTGSDNNEYRIARNADDLVRLIKDYSTSFETGNKRKAYETNKALSEVDLSVFTDIDQTVDINAPIDMPNSLPKKVESKTQDLKDKLEKLKDNEYSYNDPNEYESKVIRLEGEISRAEKAEVLKTENKPGESKEKKVSGKVSGTAVSDILDPMGGLKDSEGNYTMSNQEWTDRGRWTAMMSLIEKPSIIDNLILQELKASGVNTDNANGLANVHGMPLIDFITETKNDVFKYSFSTFKPETKLGVKSSFAGWVVSRLRDRVANRSNIAKATFGKIKSLDIPDGELGFIGDLVSTEYADQAFKYENDPAYLSGKLEAGVVKENVYSPKFKSLIDSNLFKPETVPFIEKTVAKSMAGIKSRIDTPTTINKSVKPVIKDIKDRLGNEIDALLKTEMGELKGGTLRKWMLENKKTVLENSTTTFLMGRGDKGGIPQAIQKSVGGKWEKEKIGIDEKNR
jgi:hypothetical protein